MKLNNLILYAVGVVCLGLGCAAWQPKAACGGIAGDRFTDETFHEIWHGISRVTIHWNSDVIRGIEMNYTLIRAPPRGTPIATDTHSFTLDGDFIKGVELDMGPTNDDPDHIMVCSITFHTNLGNKYGPYGSCQNRKCGSYMGNGTVLYINGRQSDLGLEWIEFIFQPTS